MKKIILILVVTLLFAFSVSAQSLQDECEITIGMYDFAGQKIPRLMPYKNEVFNAYDFKGNPIAHLVIKNKEIISYGCDVVEDATYKVSIRSVDTIKNIQDAKSPMKEFNKKLKTKEIQVKGVKLTKKLKWAFTKPVVKIGSWFS
jgi:hypothetical protein